MLFPKLARLLSSLAVIMLLAISCGTETTIDTAETPSSAVDAAEPTAVPPAAATEPTAAPATSEPEPTTATTETIETDEAASEDQDTPDEDGGVVLESREDAIAYIVSEGFVAADAECIVDGAYQVFGTWDFAELDPDPEQDEELDTLLDECITTVPGPAEGSPPPGTDPELDALWVSCVDGSADACDELYWSAPVDSDYEAFGLSCGGRALDSCSDLLGDDSGDSASDTVDGPAEGSLPPGTDAELDALWASCTGGSADACDELFWTSPADSDYEAYGLSCGGRGFGDCSEVIGE